MKIDLPNNLDAERNVLGACLIDPSAVSRIQDSLAPEDFYDQPNRVTYSAIIDILKTGSALDTIIVASYLRRHGKLQDVGGIIYLDSLTSDIGTSAYIEDYAKEVKDASVRRVGISYLQEALRAVIESPDAASALDIVESKLLKLSTGNARGRWIDSSSASEMLKEKIARARITQEIEGIKTGLDDVDSIVSAFGPGNLVVLAARPSVGKTALALNIAFNNLIGRTRRNIGMFSLEMGAVEVFMRYLALDIADNTPGMTHMRDMSQLTDRQIERAHVGLEKLSGMPFWIDDTDSLSVNEIRSRARKLAVKHPLDLLIIDYLTLISPDNDDPSNEAQRVGIHTRKLKMLARQLNVPILVLAQLNREIAKRPDPTPRLSDLRSSGAIEQDADMVLFIDRPNLTLDPTADPTIAKIIVAKNRQGPTGDVDVAWDAERARFFNLRR